VFISVVQAGLESFVREQLPLSEDTGDVSFDTPNDDWAAKLNRVTVNFFLYDIARSTVPTRSPTRRQAEDGHPAMRRSPQPMVELSYLVSAWAGSVKDEHMLLGDLVSRLVGSDHIPVELLPQELSTSVSLNFGGDDHNKNRELWSGLGGKLKASFTLHADVAADTFDWIEAAPPVERVEGLTAPVPSHGTAENGGTRAIDRSPFRR
jgi:hypothetical protein